LTYFFLVTVVREESPDFVEEPPDEVPRFTEGREDPDDPEDEGGEYDPPDPEEDGLFTDGLEDCPDDEPEVFLDTDGALLREVSDRPERELLACPDSFRRTDVRVPLRPAVPAPARSAVPDLTLLITALLSPVPSVMRSPTRREEGLPDSAVFARPGDADPVPARESKPLRSIGVLSENGWRLYPAHPSSCPKYLPR